MALSAFNISFSIVSPWSGYILILIILSSYIFSEPNLNTGLNIANILSAISTTCSLEVTLDIIAIKFCKKSFL